MELDIVFLTEYIEHEFDRLTKVANNDRRTLGIAEAELKIAEDYNITKKITEAQNKIIEAKVKLNIVEPRLMKLKEQYDILSSM